MFCQALNLAVVSRSAFCRPGSHHATEGQAPFLSLKEARRVAGFLAEERQGRAEQDSVLPKKQESLFLPQVVSLSICQSAWVPEGGVVLF